ncbi:MAG: hypothetical protein R3F49_14045 [Planctomycetota bacterium]
MELPGTHWTETALSYLQPGLVVCGVAWVAAEGIRAAHRRAYNLTKVETTPQDAPGLSFTKVDHEARAAALARGDAYAEERARDAAAAAAAGTPPLAPWGKLARMAARVVAAGVVALLPPTASGVAAREGVNVSVTDIAKQYPLGVGLAVLVLVVSLVQLVRSRAAA